MAKKALPPTGGPGHAGHRASRGSKQPIDEGTVPMVVAVIADGYVYGATETASSDTAEDPRYWLQLRLDREPYALFRATVPNDLADKLEAQGTSDQEFSDGYEAMRAVAPYMEAEPFYESPEEWENERGELDEARRGPRRPHGPPKPVVVDIECASPREWQWFKNMAIEQGWARATSGEYSLELTDLPENLPERFHQAVQAAGCKIKVLSESVKETVMSSRVRKPIADLIEELKSWLPNYNHGPTEYPTILFRTLAAAPGGGRLEDMGYEPIGNLGWHELDQLGRVLEAIQDKRDVEDLVAGLVDDEEEDLGEARRPTRSRPKSNYTVEPGRNIYRDGQPFISISREGRTIPATADEVTHVLADALNRSDWEPRFGFTSGPSETRPTPSPATPRRPPPTRRK
jgi:hypothetical protein